MKDKEITKIIKEWIVETKFPYGWEEGFLDTCSECENRWEDKEENKELLIENYLLWGNWDFVDLKNER
tara:strand:+ start:15 stop:218 length:204 start_codon:yes stop_codon:yes gene_type:complete